jgi:DNA-binding transcriptional MerR regulator
VEVKVMSEYLTGELSDMFGISNRTIQYYNKKGLLKPAYIKENSYRVYTENEVERTTANFNFKRNRYIIKRY